MFMKVLLTGLGCLMGFLSRPMAQTAPTREAFAAQAREVSRVPLEAFAFAPDAAKELKIEIWASSPLIFSPVAMDIDALGRVWATEGIDYHVGRRVEAGQSIIVLSDTDADGKADRSQVFVSEKNSRPAPLGIAVFDNRIVLSSTPDLIVYTDLNRNAVFDEGDTREVLLTGFKNKTHDHTLHAVVGAPSGQWYFSYGNSGADLKTKDGRHFLSACYYGHADAIGKRSSDGHLYVGGMAMRMNPDGTGLHPVGENLRNTHDMFVTSMGDVYHSDNDDPAQCRVTWLMEYGNLGYADLRDGSKSWEEVGKSWEEPQAGSSRGRRRYSLAHWRQNYPGTIPPGDVYGAGSPTGNVFIEGDELGEQFRGYYLVCDMVRKGVIAHKPKLVDSQIEMGELHDFLRLKDGSKGEHFLPTDLALAPDGSLFLADFYNNTSRRTVQVEGTIYRISRKDEKQPGRTSIDYTTAKGLLDALKNPAVHVRWVAQEKLVEGGEGCLPALKSCFENETNPYLRARAIWVMARVGPSGQEEVKSLLKHPDQRFRVVAYRALRHVLPGQLLAHAALMAGDTSPALRREVALSLRDIPYGDCREILSRLLDGYDGENRWYLEALGTAFTGKEVEVYNQLIRPRFVQVPFGQWPPLAVNLAWRIHTPQANDDLQRVMLENPPSLDVFRRLVMAYALFDTEAQRLDGQEKLEALARAPGYEGEAYQQTITEVLDRDMRGLKGELLRTSYQVPTSFGAPTKLSNTGTIAALPGDAGRGKAKAGVCLTCHKISGAGVAFGPNLGAWGKERTVPEIIHELLNPAEHLAHGYDKPVRVRSGTHVAEGLLMNYSHHAGSLKLKIFGGTYKKILFRRSGAKVEHLKNHSWMPPVSEMGLNDQDVRDIAEYLKRI
jgi:putative membrane-bound dehydrogenase-like protein